jgi:hypothetical protein
MFSHQYNLFERFLFRDCFGPPGSPPEGELTTSGTPGEGEQTSLGTLPEGEQTTPGTSPESEQTSTSEDEQTTTEGPPNASQKLGAHSWTFFLVATTATFTKFLFIFF